MSLDRMKTQKNEFDTLAALTACLKRAPQVVDDDYPEWRHEYEERLRIFLRAVKENRPDQWGRI